MKLSTYLRDRHETQTAFAARLAVSPNMVSRYVCGRIPEPGIMARIAVLTDGAVTPNDFILPEAMNRESAPA